jgi:hypothetical protein
MEKDNRCVDIGLVFRPIIGSFGNKSRGNCLVITHK